MKQVRVLLADDHALFREGLAGILAAQPDMEVVGEARDGLEAVVKALELKPDLVLMDVHLAEVDAINILAAIRADRLIGQVPVIMTSGMDVEDKCLAAGASAFMLKPFRPSDLMNLIKQQLVAAAG